MATILIAEDEAKMRKILALALSEDGHEILEAQNAEEAASTIRTHSVSLVISDLRMPGGGGMALLKSVQEINHYIPVIILTAYGTIENAVDALKNGAVDYLLKPCDLDEIKLAVEKALQIQQLELENIYLRNEISDHFGDDVIISRSESMKRVTDLVKRVSQGDGIVLISGESGCGKEMIARSIHLQSARREKAFVTVKCAGIPADLLEIELFGRVRNLHGGPTGPLSGKFELANSGTLFLDEVGELPSRIQGKILRTLSDSTIEPVGGVREKKVDVRIIAATRHDLEERVQNEMFRSELYYRLNVLPIRLPPLRERTEDIPPLIEHYLNMKTSGKPPLSFTQSDMNEMVKYSWPGNVRELQNLVERALVLGSTSAKELLPPSQLAQETADSLPLQDQGLLEQSYKEAKKFVLERFERAYFSNVLKKTNGNVSRAAKMADVHRKNLHVKISELGLDPHKLSQTDDSPHSDS
ncbi:MAG: sigma-54 dependent transcriptional regulator [Candidatus Hinthialibacter antarcticus]|nr:sigma-54 dependent transcriptional regulator [Candidatus Hinthialibacter antarcticus]